MGRTACLTFFILIISYALVKAQGNKITIDFVNIPLEKALTKLMTDYNIQMSFSPESLPANPVINKSFRKASVTEILDVLLRDTKLFYTMQGQEFIILPAKPPRVVFSGHVKDSVSGEDLVGCAIYFPSIKNGVATNNYGYFSLAVPVGDYIVQASQIGFKKNSIHLNLKAALDTTIFLASQADSLKEVSVHPVNNDDHFLATAAAGASLPLNFMRKHPSKGGDPDVIKGLQMQTGIEKIAGSSSSFFVHGGNQDQNLILFDEAPVYNPGHLYGFVSIFNPDAINHIQVYTNDIPANFGGRLSSVLDVRMNDGDNKEFHIKGGLSFLSARLSAEGPIVKDKGSFLVTFRKSLTNFFNNYFQLYPVRGTYDDFNLKLNYNINSRNRIFYSTYAGSDHLISRNKNTNNWGNYTSTFRWNHLFNNQIFSNISGIYSNYYNRLDINATRLTDRFTWNTGINDVILKADLTYFQTPESSIKIGLDETLHRFIPGETKVISTSSIAGSMPRKKSIENAAYVTHQLIILNTLDINYGLRFSWFKNLNESTETGSADPANDVITEGTFSGQNFFRAEPRFSLQYRLSQFHLLNFAYNRNYQFLQLAQNDELAFSSLEVWLPADRRIPPQYADFYSSGYRFFFDDLTFGVNTYYKKMGNQLALANHTQIILNPDVESNLGSGKSVAYGTEFNLSKTKGKLQGDLGYTWSRVTKTIGVINKGQTYPANYDIPNDLKIALTYQFSQRFSLNSFFTYKTGRPITLPIGYYFQNDVRVPIYEEKNASRLPDYSRLDLSAEIKFGLPVESGRHWQSSWVVSLYNVYNKKNILFYRINNGAQTNHTSGISPAIAYNFKF